MSAIGLLLIGLGAFALGYLFARDSSQPGSIASIPTFARRRTSSAPISTASPPIGLLWRNPFLRRRRELQEAQLAEIDQPLADWPCMKLELSVESPAGTDALGRLGHHILDPSAQSPPVAGDKVE